MHKPFGKTLGLTASISAPPTTRPMARGYRLVHSRATRLEVSFDEGAEEGARRTQQPAKCVQ